MRIAIVSLLFACLAGYASAHSYFIAELKTDDGDSIGEMEAYIHDGEWTWTLNSTESLLTAEIADRRGDALNPVLTSLVDLDLQKEPLEIDGGAILTYNGTFDDSAIEVENMPKLFKEERNMTNALQLAGHMCMGHIFAVVNTTDGVSAYGPLTYAKDGDCYEGTGTESMRMAMGGSMGGDMDHSSEDGHDHGDMDHSSDDGHDHGSMDGAMGTTTAEASSGVVLTGSLWSAAVASVVAMLSLL
jgi:hypothetical protein